MAKTRAKENKKKRPVTANICKSKQLQTNTKKTKSTKNKPPKICGNGKPMPRLCELETLYEDTETEHTPEVSPVIEQKKGVDIIPPETVSKIANNLLEYLSNISDVSMSVDVDEPPSSVKPMRRPPKTGIPYINGCNDRRQVLFKPKVKVGQSSEKFGITNKTNIMNEEDNCGALFENEVTVGQVAFSKSIFNPKSAEIAANLQVLDDDSNDSNKTVCYEVYQGPEGNSPQRTFSPLPSTSRDDVTIQKNDAKFNNSQSDSDNKKNVEIIDVQFNNYSNSKVTEDVEIVDVQFKNNFSDHNDQKDVEIIDVKLNNNFRKNKVTEDVEIIDVQFNNQFNDTNDRKGNDLKIKNNSSESDETKDVEIIEIPCETIVLDDDNNKPNQWSNEVIIKGPQKKPTYPSFIDDDSSSVENKWNDIHEIIDVDDVIASNKSVLQKYRMDTPDVTIVSSSTSNSFPTTPSSSDVAEFRNRIRNKLGSINSLNMLETLNVMNNMRTNEMSGTNMTASSDPTKGQSSSNINKMKLFVSLINFHLIENCDKCTEEQRKQSSNKGHQCTLREGFRDPTIMSCPSGQGVHCLCQLQNAENKSVNIFPFDNLSHFLTKSPERNTVQATCGNISQDINNISNVQRFGETPDSTVKKIGDCPICMENLTNKSVASTTCGHIFCMPCIKASVKVRASGKRCPTCRKPLKGVMYHQIFL